MAYVYVRSVRWSLTHYQLFPEHACTDSTNDQIVFSQGAMRAPWFSPLLGFPALQPPCDGFNQSL